MNLSYDVFDFGRRRAEVRERQTQLSEAEENLERLKDEVAVQVERTYNKLKRTKSMVEVAQQWSTLRTEGERLLRINFARAFVLVAAAKAGVDV